MILYKYMTFDAAEKILESNSIGFAKPHTFNDPFELEAGYPVEPLGDPISEIIGNLKGSAKRFMWADSTGVLCLTRNPLNPLMWAHYANGHKGVVLGIDIGKAGFLSTDTCLIPAQFGNLIYTHTRPTHLLSQYKAISPLHIARTFHYAIEHTEKLQRLFLYKSSCWAYEEEVRVVKCLSDRNSEGRNKSGLFHEVLLPEQKILYSLKLPEGAISEIYFGLKHPFSTLNQEQDEIFNNFKNKYQNLLMKKCFLSTDTWSIEVADLV